MTEERTTDSQNIAAAQRRVVIGFKREQEEADDIAGIHKDPQAVGPVDRGSKYEARAASLPDPEDLAAGYELSDLSVRGAVVSIVGLLILMAVTVALTTGFQAINLRSLPSLTAPSGGVADPPREPVPPEIPRRANTGDERREFEAAERAQLESYGWVDQQAGVVRIPIDRAIELLAARGLPTRPAAEAEGLRDTGEGLPTDASSGRTLDAAPGAGSGP